MLPSTRGVQALQEVQAGLVGRVAKLYEEQQSSLRIATVDQDATIIESHQRAALSHDEGGRGYQPMVAVWVEADLILADEFRDGNVPARQEPLNCARLAFGALPGSIRERYFRGDSACHENELIGWLRHADREKEPGGRIGFAIRAVMSRGLEQALAAVKESHWKTFGTEADGTLRQWAEVDSVPGDPTEKKDSQPLRYVGLRLLKPQGVLFADGSDRHHHAVVTNLPWAGDRLLKWHQEKAGTVEHVHDEVKNALAGGHLPSQHFAVNVAWFKRTLMAYHLAGAIRGLCFSPEERTMRFQRYRLKVVLVAGRMSRLANTLRLRL
ncbi:MAG: transposase [Verrucomicrobiota bacterium]